jgi:hypothetical protein
METILQRYPYKMHQVLDDHRGQSGTESNDHCQDVKEAASTQVPDLEIIKPGYELFSRHGMTKIAF